MITIKNVTLRRSAKVLLEGASVTLNPGEKVGLVGRNGAGKSSLFALLNGGLHEDSGEFYIPTQWRMGQVAQDMPETDQSATAFVIEGDTVLTDARTRGVPIRLTAIGAAHAVAGADHTLADADGRVRQRYGVPASGGAYLLRPDQHVCARWLTLDATRLQAALATALPQ